MAKIRSKRSSQTNRRSKTRDLVNSSQPTTNPSILLAQAADLLQTGQPDLALAPTEQALALLSPNGSAAQNALPALSLLGEIQLEMGDPESALETFRKAAALDPQGQLPELEGGGAEKFLWLAQLDDEGGQQSIQWFQLGVTVLEREIGALENQKGQEDDLAEKSRKLAAALCGMVEIWMTDLSYVTY